MCSLAFGLGILRLFLPDIAGLVDRNAVFLVIIDIPS
jgi:hypothetical protein